MKHNCQGINYVLSLCQRVASDIAGDKMGAAMGDIGGWGVGLGGFGLGLVVLAARGFVHLEKKELTCEDFCCSPQPTQIKQHCRKGRVVYQDILFSCTACFEARYIPPCTKAIHAGFFLGEWILRVYMRDLYSHSHEYRKLFLSNRFPHLSHILESELFAIGPVQCSWPRGVAVDWFTKPGFWEHLVALS